MNILNYILKIVTLIGFGLKMNAQSEILVLDEKTKDPIIFATIIYKDNVGTFTNDKGLFLLDTTFAKLTVKSIGYRDINLDTKNIKDTILMLQQPINLEQVIVIPLPKKFKFSKIDMKTNNDFPKSYLSFIGNEISTLISGSKNSKKSYLENVTIPINSSILKVKINDQTKAKEVNEPFCSIFQINFYENENRQPGKLLDYDPIIIKLTEKDDKYFRIDFSKKNIIVPAEGIFIGLMAIGRADEKGNLLLENPYEEKLTQNGIIRIGLSIRPLIPVTDEIGTNNTFIRYLFKINKLENWSVFDKYSFSNSKTEIHNALNLGIGYELKNYD